MNINQLSEEIDALRKRVGEKHFDAMPDGHIAQDEIFEKVLRAIASGESEDPVALCKKALEILEIDFPRWYE